EPDNQKYKDAYDRLTGRMNYQGQTAYGGEGQNQNGQPVNPEAEQMGGSGCSQCLDCCYTYLCINCLFNLCCGCR
ncbi:MAG: hypothetical protein J6Z36_00005, partial [Clostridia bacterium]|nr:hypothetical protein [Clostridia bacterium]